MKSESASLVSQDSSQLPSENALSSPNTSPTLSPSEKLKVFGGLERITDAMLESDVQKPTSLTLRNVGFFIRVGRYVRAVFVTSEFCHTYLV